MSLGACEPSRFLSLSPWHAGAVGLERSSGIGVFLMSIPGVTEVWTVPFPLRNTTLCSTILLCTLGFSPPQASGSWSTTALHPFLDFHGPELNTARNTSVASALVFGKLGNVRSHSGFEDPPWWFASLLGSLSLLGNQASWGGHTVLWSFCFIAQPSQLELLAFLFPQVLQILLGVSQVLQALLQTLAKKSESLFILLSCSFIPSDQHLPISLTSLPLVTTVTNPYLWIQLLKSPHTSEITRCLSLSGSFHLA